MTKKKYKNAAEKQKAYRLRHGQKPKVPLEIRRGEKLGSQEGDLRARKEGETWEGYHMYIKGAIQKAKFRLKDVVVMQEGEDGDSIGAKRSVGGYKEPTMSEDYYEIRERYEKELEQKQKGRKISKK